jgi:hypothetical protein
MPQCQLACVFYGPSKVRQTDAIEAGAVLAI